MEKFSYALEFYRGSYFELDDTELFKQEVEIAQKTENYFIKYSNNLDEIRKSILVSYKFQRELPLDDRISYVKGIIFSRQFMNEQDVSDLVDDFERRNNDKSYDKTIFNIRTWSDEFDYDFYYNFLRNSSSNKTDAIYKKSEKFIEFMKNVRKNQENELEEANELVKDNSVALEDEDYEEDEEEDEEKEQTVEEFFKNKSYTNSDISLLDRLEMAKEYFPDYVEGTLRFKNIDIDNKEYPLIVMGMNDYNKYIVHVYETTYRFLAEEYLRNTKNLSLLIK